ncbi:MAG: hypothetical protein IPF95_10790 [Flavobacteriales bacterium]|nr:hypothetical protein [Flavobacteriales bacterium]MBK6943076.1 hypothetical protein [Flavobacteriales bacterium]MBP6311979.1 hypothetical protein [Flavobacteriales bacterium]
MTNKLEMRTKTWRYVLLGIIGLVLFIGLVLGVGFITAMLSDKLDENIIWTFLILLILAALINLFIIGYRNKKNLKTKIHHYFDIGKIIFSQYKAEFEAYYTYYLNNQTRKFRPIDALAAFADNKGLSLVIDWRGEENEGEIEEFINSKVDTLRWPNTVELREQYLGRETRDGKFIIRLFKALEKDLKQLNHQLLFFDLGGDSYVFIITDATTFKNIMKSKDIDLHGAGKLRI